MTSKPAKSQSEKSSLHTSTIYLSSLLGEERLPFQDSEIILGRAHYSWKFITKLYEVGLTRAGFLTKPIVRPEIYQAPVAHEVLGIGPSDLHVAIKPVEHLRPFYGLPNLFICGWEFPEFFRGVPDMSPFYDQLAVLSRADRILCWTDFTRDNLRKAGLSHAVTLPPPIQSHTPGAEIDVLSMPSVFLASERIDQELRLLSFGEALADRSEPIILAILNPFDRRKQIDKLLEGAKRARAAGAEFLLVVKLVIDGQTTTISNINEILHSTFGYRETSGSVVFCSGHLEEAAMAALRTRADFHLGAPSAEGLNLPLLEAALQGIPVITTRNTAMETYLGEQDAVWIETAPELTNESVNAFVKYTKFTHFPASAEAVGKAICAALSLSEVDRRELTRRARAAVEARFGQQRFEADFRALAEEVLR